MRTDRHSRRRPWLTRATLLLLSAIVVVLTLELDSSRRDTRVWRDRANSLVLRSFAPMSEGRSVDGASVQFGRTDGRGQLYLVYRTDCVFCERSLVAWMDLFQAAHASAVDVLGVSLSSEEETRSYQAEHALPFVSAVVEDQRVRDIHRFWSVPQTIILAPDGRVLFTRIGMMEPGPGLDSAKAVLQALATPGSTEGS